MYYNINYAVGSIPFLLLTIVFYFGQKRLRDERDSIFSHMLLLSLYALVFDVLSALLDARRLACPGWALYAVNALSLLAMQGCLPAFFYYSLASAGLMGKIGKRRLWVLIPFVATAALLLPGLGRSGIFFIDEGHAYQHGAAHFTLYVNAAFYLVTSLCTLFGRRRSMLPVKRTVTFSFMAVLLAAMLLQMRFPRYMITTPATALALTVMYYVLQSPTEMTDPLTEAYSRMLLPSLLRSRDESGRPYTLLLHSLYSFDEMAQMYGFELSEKLLAAYSALLRDVYAGEIVVYMDTSEFTVVLDGGLDEEEIRRRVDKMPLSLAVAGYELPLRVGYAAIVHDAEDAGSVESVMTAMDFLYQRLRESQSDKLLLAGGAFREECDRMARLESSAQEIAAEGAPRLLTTDVRDAAGKTAWTRAELRFAHEAAQNAAPVEVMNAIGRAGAIRQYYEKLFEACGKAGLCNVCLSLPPLACIRSDSADRLLQMTEQAGLRANEVMFTISEQDAAAGLPVMRDNILALARMGFALQIDQFADGYTDLSTLGRLPVQSVEISAGLLKRCRDSERHRRLLRCLADIAHGSGKRVVCAGADTDADVSNALAAGADFVRAEARKG